MIIKNFIGFIGTVVDIDGVDSNFGKVQIQIVGDQGESTFTPEDLLWAMVMVPTTSPAERGIGTSPNWLNVGSTVFGIFLDGNYRNIPMVLGAINQDKTIGHGISKYASGENLPLTYTKTETDAGVEQQRKPNYKNNKVITTSSKESPDVINHIIEIDDTPGSERLIVVHKNGSYVEMLTDGTTIVKATKIALVGDDIKAIATGNIDVETEGSFIVKAKDVSIDAESINIKSDVDIAGAFTITGDVNITGSVAVIGTMTLNGRPVLTG